VRHRRTVDGALYRIRTLDLPIASSDKDYVQRVVDQPLTPDGLSRL